MSTLRQQVRDASARAEVRDAVLRVYADLQTEIDARKPLCTASGRCCRFEEFGHRLYVTTIELAAFVGGLTELPLAGTPALGNVTASLPLPGTPGRGQGRGANDAAVNEAPGREFGFSGQPKPDSTRTLPLSLTLSPGYRGEGTGGSRGCPFQIDGLCSVHTIRPFGCRVFFCDATSDDWQHAQYERFHAQLKGLHEQFDVPYQYLEWREALRQELFDAAQCENQFDGARKTLSLPQLRL